MSSLEFLAESGASLAGHFVLLYKFFGFLVSGRVARGWTGLYVFLKVVCQLQLTRRKFGAMETRTLFLVALLPVHIARNLLASVVLFIPGHLPVLVIFVFIHRQDGFLVAHEFSLAPSSPVSGCGF